MNVNSTLQKMWPRAKPLLRLAVVFAIADVTIMARFPDSIERRVSLKGTDAQLAAALLGFSKDKEVHLKLPLGEHDVQAYSVTKVKSKAGKAQAPLNNLNFVPHPTPLFEIYSHWLDSPTGSMDPVPQYTFSSPFIPADSIAKSEWAPLLKALKLTTVKAAKSARGDGLLVVNKSTGAKANVLVVVTVQIEYLNTAPGFIVSIGVDERSPKKRAEILREYKKSEEQSKNLD